MSLPEKRPRQGIYPDGSILFRVNSERRGENKENTKKNELNREQTVVSIPAARIDWGAANRREKEALGLESRTFLGRGHYGPRGLHQPPDRKDECVSDSPARPDVRRRTKAHSREPKGDTRELSHTEGARLPLVLGKYSSMFQSRRLGI